MSGKEQQNGNDSFEKLQELRSEISVAMAQTMDLYGVPPSIGRLYAILYFSDEPKTLDELRDMMGMSKTSMSTGVRRLEKNKMVKKVWKKGVRKHLYEGETDFFNTFLNFFIPMWKREIEVNMEAIKKVEPELKEMAESSDGEVSKEAEKDLKKLEEAKQYYIWLNKLARSIESGEIFDFIPKE
ncbi:choline uptake/conversion transcriptional regulator CudC [Natranaerobius thermophilus]|uniref:HTH-type transcriptional regulator n=1 Tax=Natranaerobius thermophilus (strain ATCC BAA-1301 / DSM 18059 / JW/NM-WN-LF) TaxID=457570 RepID=B2A733_NATTJ|nr:transcriptional regulator [Natranaerobius thermophilus]ACB85624.1 YuaC [Natranaerobius thermophilus JW/NM-WN-LF]